MCAGELGVALMAPEFPDSNRRKEVGLLQGRPLEVVLIW